MSQVVANLLLEGIINKDVEILHIDSTGIRVVKLFSNAYSELCVVYFNDLNTYQRSYGLDSSQIIDGVSLNAWIGSHHNNFLFSYGGYSFPKNIKQLRANYSEVSNIS